MADIFPQAMANFRGLTYFFFRGPSEWASTTLVIASVAALVLTLKSWARARLARDLPGAHDKFDQAFSTTVLFALLVSFHLNPHDLSLLLLPLLVLLRVAAPRLADFRGWITTGLIAILFLPALHLWALSAGRYGLVGIPLLLLFLIGAGGLTTPATSPGKATTIPG